jgi:D-glycero-alpha-D-manno-heptose-7-phosphate kinase
MRIYGKQAVGNIMAQNILNKTINASAPIRICDIGGWTDTWFAGHGAVFNIAVRPCVEVQIKKVENRSSEKRVQIDLENFGDNYSVDPENIVYDKHPLIEAAVDAMDIPENIGFEINIFSEAPPGASTGTSAAVSVALIGALDSLSSGHLTAHEAAGMAHYLETEKLGLQCGIQDQLCSAYGGINFIDMHQFPYASVSPIPLSDSIWWELEQRLAVVYIGRPHSSSDIHKKVIADLGANAAGDSRLQELRRFARTAKDAVYDGDFPLLGRMMDGNTEVQRELHRDLVCERFEEVISICKHYDALGCKVNGAGGDGGSVTILCDGNSSKKRKLIEELKSKECQALNISLSRRGLRVW